MPGELPAAILDLDGTLVDTNYHHALAWYRAFREHGITLPLWQLHRHVGMGGDKYVEALAGIGVEERIGEKLRSRWEAIFDDLLDEISPLAGAGELVRDLKARGQSVVLASSSIQGHFDLLVEKLGVGDLVDSSTTKDDVESSKPDPDLVEAALEKAGTRNAVMVGDTPWDCEAAARAGIPTITVMTGGFSEQELLDSGSIAVYESIDELRKRISETPLGRAR